LSVHHSETPPADKPAAAGGIGRSLRHSREARGLTVSDAAHALKLTLRQVEALEAEQFDRLPGAAFARGFLRNYARLVHLDPEPLIADFDAFHAGAAVELRPLSNAQGALPSGGAGRSPSAMPAALAAAGLLGLVVAGWYFDWFRQPASTAPAESSAPATVLPPAASPAEGGSGVPAAAPPALSSPGGEAASAAPGSALVGPAPRVVAAEAQAAAGQPLGDVAAGPDGLERLVFAFGQEAWVEVRDVSGEIIFSRIGKAGSTQEVQGKGPFALVVGNAQNVKLSHNGKPVDLAPYTAVSVARLTLR